MGLVLDSLPAGELDAALDAIAERMAGVPVNQLAIEKMVIIQAIDARGMTSTQRLATPFDWGSRHAPGVLSFEARGEAIG